MAKTVVAFALAASLFWAAPAAACDCITLDPKGPHFTRDLDRIAQYYPVAAEGVVVADGPYSWRFRTTREYRGTGAASYPIDLISDCSLGPDEIGKIIGKPVFLVLAGGPDRYEASRCVNLLGAEVDAAIRKRIIGSCNPR
jgi:hypothetical protein